MDHFSFSTWFEGKIAGSTGWRQSAVNRLVPACWPNGSKESGLKSSDSWGKQVIQPCMSVSKDFMSYIRGKKRKQPWGKKKKKNNHRKKTTKDKWEIIWGLKGGIRILLANPNPDAGTKIENPTHCSLCQSLRDTATQTARKALTEQVSVKKCQCVHLVQECS